MRIYPLSKLIFPSLMFIVLIINISCGDKQKEYIPYAYVNFTVDLNINNNLKSPGYSMIYPGGYGGVVVYCYTYDFSAPSNSIYYAYDATCTYEISDTCSIVNKDHSMYGVCPYCHSKFDFNTGYPISGVALYPLKSYTISVLNDVLYVNN